MSGTETRTTSRPNFPDRCKRLQETRFGFLDFLTPRHATSALSNRKNHFFQGRKLVLQVSTTVRFARVR